MRWRIPLAAASALLGLATVPVSAEEHLQPSVKLTVTLDQAKLIVETLGAVSCPTVRQLATCNAAAALLKEIQQQTLAQMPK
jgi:hypothetical protein